MDDNCKGKKIPNIFIQGNRKLDSDLSSYQATALTWKKGGPSVGKVEPLVKSVKSSILRKGDTQYSKSGEQKSWKFSDIKPIGSSNVQTKPGMVPVLGRQKWMSDNLGKQKKKKKKELPYSEDQSTSEMWKPVTSDGSTKRKSKKKSKSQWLFNLHKRRKRSKEKPSPLHSQCEPQVTIKYGTLQDQTWPVCNVNFPKPLNLNVNQQPAANRADWQYSSNSMALDYNDQLLMPRNELQVQAEDAIHSFDCAMSLVSFPPTSVNSVVKEQNNQQVATDNVVQLIDKICLQDFLKQLMI